MTFVAAAAVLAADVVSAQIDQQRAAEYFKEAQALCERDGGRLWGVSLCGPIVIADPVTKTIATNQPPPVAPRPPVLGFANAALNWGGTRWTTLAWPLVPADDRLRKRLLIHELFHRVQPQLGFFLPEGASNAHLDTPEGRYWLQLEWRALAKALQSDGAQRAEAIADALAFREARHRAFAGAAETERILEINEGLAQYTGTVLAAASPADAVNDAIAQLSQAEKTETFVRTFPYPLGAAYGVLLDRLTPGWTRKITSSDDLGRMVMSAARVQPSPDVEASAARYDGPALRVSETRREEEQKRHVAELRKVFVEGPIVVFPASRNNSFTTEGMTSLPDEGIVYPTFRANAEWGTLTAKQALMAADRSRITVPGPATVDGAALSGEGWTAQLNPGWIARPGQRTGDLEIVRGKR